jgi:putative redox protein
VRVDQETRLCWTGEEDVYEGGRVGGIQTLVDSDAVRGPSPVDSILLGLSACMAIDVRMILEKSRVPLNELSVSAQAERNETPPRRLLKVRLQYRLSGPGPGDQAKVQRAIDLSRDRYCSVLHSLAPDIELTTEVELG